MTAVATARVGPAGPPARLPRLLGTGPAGGVPAAPRTLAEHRAQYGPLPAPRDAPARSALVEAVTAAGLRGRGGAGFPTGRKMATVASGRRRPVVIANGCESEPASGKDAALLTLVPHLVLDGAVLAAAAVGADEAYVCVHRDSGRAERLEYEIAQRHDDPIRLRVVQVPRRYVASEESALVHLINGGDARPLAVPPRPYERGVLNRPTLVDNVETLAHLAQIAYFGPHWFRRSGLPGDPGTSLVTVGGAVRHPGVYEMEPGTTVEGLLNLAGGVTEPVQAVLVGGYAGVWVPLPHGLTVPLSHDPAGPGGAALGAGAIVALPAASCGVSETARVLGYLAGESAQQCGPCMFGLPAIAEDLGRIAHGRHDRTAYQRFTGRMEVIAGRGACRHPDGAIRLAGSALRAFEADLAAHLRRQPCRGMRRAPVLPVPGRGERERSWR